MLIDVKGGPMPRVEKLIAKLGAGKLVKDHYLIDHGGLCRFFPLLLPHRLHLALPITVEKGKEKKR